MGFCQMNTNRNQNDYKQQWRINVAVLENDGDNYIFCCNIFRASC